MIQYRDRQRQKAFIGAIIGAAASIAGGIIKGNKQKKAQEKAQAEAQAAQDHKDALQNAQALTSAYANQDYVEPEKWYDKLGTWIAIAILVILLIALNNHIVGYDNFIGIPSEWVRSLFD